MDSLLDKARAAEMVRPSLPPNADRAQLAIAWAFGEVSLLQVGEALRCSGSSAYSSLARGLRDGVTLGLLVRPAPQKNR